MAARSPSERSTIAACPPTSPPPGTTPTVVMPSLRVTWISGEFGLKPSHTLCDAVTASHKVWEGFNPNSPLIQVTRNDGITTVGVVPGGGLVGGQAAMVDLSDGDLAAMMLQAPIAMTADIGSKGDQVGGTRAEVLQRLRDLLADTREYMRRRADYEKNATRELAARRGDLEALIPVVQGRLPLVIDANRASEIESALNLAKEFSLKIMISGG